MINMKNILIILFLQVCFSQKILIPMDHHQTDHLKAYGIAFQSLKESNNVEWLLNYRGGSFLLDDKPQIHRDCTVKGI